MCFNLGITRLKKFKKFLTALSERNWELYCYEMMDSRLGYTSQTKSSKITKTCIKRRLIMPMHKRKSKGGSLRKMSKGGSLRKMSKGGSLRRKMSKGGSLRKKI